MKRHWVIVGAGILIAAAVGFQQVEPLHQLRQYGSLHQGVGHGVGANEYSFVPPGMPQQSFVDSLAVLAGCTSVRVLVVPKMANRDDTLTRVAKMKHVLSLSIRSNDATDDDGDDWTDRDRGWSVELKIPWASFGHTGGRPEPGAEWRLALCRYDYDVAREAPELSTCAALTVANFHRHEDYRPLIFVGPQAAVGP